MEKYNIYEANNKPKVTVTKKRFSKWKPSK